MLYTCKLCNKDFLLKSNYLTHLNRKNPCVKEQIKCKKCNRYFTLLSDLQKHQNKKNPCDKKIILKCKICNKQYITLRNYNKHIKSHPEINNISNTNKINNDQQTINIMNNSHNTTNITNNVVNNINITINKFGKEDVQHITDEVLVKILNDGYKSFNNLIKEIHFNKDVPQNHNVYIPNINKKNALIFDGERWILLSKNKILDDLIDNNDTIITNNDVRDKMTSYAINRLNRFINDYNDPDKIDDIKKNIKNDIEMILYNYRDVVENTRKNIKLQSIKNK